jgi:hypothetical protein
MDNQTKIIYAYVYSPSDKKSKAACTTIHCSNSHNCGLYKRNQCILLGGILDHQSCPYGRLFRTHGYTRAAKNFYNWINNQREQYKDIPHTINVYKETLTEIGDFIFLPYSFMNMNEYIPFKIHGGLFSNGSYLLPKEHFTIENIIKICEYKPQALMGGEITSYQQKIIPIFLQHLSETFPDIFKDLSIKYPRANSISLTFTNVGREAYLRTLNPNVATFTDIHGGIWTWDGEYLISTNGKMAFGLISNYTEIKLKPHPNSIVKVFDDKQVNDKTIFC